MSNEKAKNYIQPDYSLLNQEHVKRYRETGGEVGHIWNGATALLLTMTGRKSGKSLTTPLIYAADGDDYIVIASKGGAPTHPAWYLNLRHDPAVQVATGGGPRRPMRARVADADERARLWPTITAGHKSYADYQTKTDREIPVVILEPAS